MMERLTHTSYDSCIQPWTSDGRLLCVDIYTFDQPDYQYYDYHDVSLHKGHATSTASLIIDTVQSTSSSALKLPIDVVHVHVGRKDDFVNILVKEFDPKGWESGYESYIQFWLDKRKIVEIDVYTIDSCYTYDMDTTCPYWDLDINSPDGYAQEIYSDGYSIPTDKSCV